MKKKVLALAIGVSLSSGSSWFGYAWAEAKMLDKIVVKDEQGRDPEEPSAKTTIERDSVLQRTTPLSVSPYRAILDEPSVNVQSGDPFGLSEVGFHETVKIRGKAQTGPASIRNIDGLPLTGNPGGGKNIIDMENIERIDVYRGAMPVEMGLGFSNLAGKAQMMTRAPAKTSQSEITATAGSDAFSRLYFRHDTGESKGVSAFVSGSKAQGDNWKGEGDMARGNVMAGLRYAPSSKFSLDLRAGWNKDERHNMRFFNYATATNFSNYRKDWGTDAKKVDYYDYNKQSFEDKFLYAIAKIQLTDNLRLTVKPYWWQDQGFYRYSNINPTTPANSRVINWQIDHHAKGIVNELDWTVTPNNLLKMGLWLHTQQPPGPPSAQQKYTVGANGMAFDGWSLLAKNDEHVTTSPYVSWLSTQDKLTTEVGLRYVNLDLGSLTLYKPAAGVSANYDNALAQSSVNTMGSVEGKNLTEWLPYLGATYKLNAQDVLHAHYGRTHGLDVNLFPFYANAAANFAAKGISLQSLWDKLRFETADTLDAGWRHTAAWGYFDVTAFVSQSKNKQSIIYDASVDARYPYNIADAFSKGIELSGAYRFNPQWRMMGNATWNRFEYQDNISLSTTQSIASKGKQVVDTPEYMVKVGLAYSHQDWDAGLFARYIGERYGDVTNVEKVSGVTLFDTSISYALHKDAKSSTSLRLDVLNLTDKAYIGPISASDDAMSGALVTQYGNGSTYQYAAPRTAFISLISKF